MAVLPDYPTPPEEQTTEAPVENTPYQDLLSFIDQLQAYPSRSQINQAAVSTQDRIEQVAGDNSVPDLCYGRVRKRAQISYLLEQDGILIFDIVWGIGAIDGIGDWQEIEQVLMNGQPAPQGVSISNYLGTPTQGIDPTMALFVPRYRDNHVKLIDGHTIALAHSVIQVPNNVTTGFPRFEVVAKTRKLYDPRTGLETYSNNPSLATADFLKSYKAFYGLGATVPDADIIACANANDEAMSDGSKRRTINTTFQGRTQTVNIIAALRTYAGCFLVPQDGQIRMIPDRPTSVTKSLTTADVLQGTLSYRHIPRRDRPNAIVCTYTDRNLEPWAERQSDAAVSLEVEAGTVPRIFSKINLPGYESHQQAYREAIERHNRFTLSNLELKFTTTDKALAYTIGDVHNVTHVLGFAKDMRLVSANQTRPGRWALEYLEYNAAIYSDTVVAEKDGNDTTLPQPNNVPAVTGLALAEEVFQPQAGVYASRIRATWNSITTYPFPFRYRLRVYDGSTLINTQDVIDAEAVTPVLQDGITYVVEVRAVASFGASGAADNESITIQGKLLPPSDVPQVTATQTGGGEATIDWTAATDLDLKEYEIRRGGVWESATKVDAIVGLQLIARNLTAGNHTFLVKAVDSGNRYSNNATGATVNIARPGNVTGFSGYEIGGQVFLFWSQASGYPSRYTVRRGPTSGFSWSSATAVNSVDALSLIISGLAAGTYRFAIRAFDGVNESAAEATVDITVTADDNSFVEAYQFSNPTLTNVKSWSHNSEANATTYYVTDMGDSIASLFGNTMDTYANPLATYHTGTANSEWLSEVYDFGSAQTGNFMATVPAVALSGTINTYLELSLDNVVWDQYTTLTRSATARYVRVRVTSSGSSTLYITTPGVKINISRRTRNVLLQNQTYDASRYVLNFQDGANSYVTIPGAPELDITGNLTIEFWLYMFSYPNNNSDFVRFFANQLTAADVAYVVRMNNTSGQFYWGDGSTTQGVIIFNRETTCPLQKWVHLAFVRDMTAQQNRMYKNGSLLHSASFTAGASSAPANAIEICHKFSSNFFHCRMDDIRLWNTVRTQQEIADNLKIDLVGNESGLVGYWNCNDGTGTTLTDATSNANNGTLTNSPTWVPQGKRIFLDEQAFLFKGIKLTPVGSTFRTSIPDEITPGSLSFFDAYFFDDTNTLVDTTFFAEIDYV